MKMDPADTLPHVSSASMEYLEIIKRRDADIMLHQQREKELADKLLEAKARVDELEKQVNTLMQENSSLHATLELERQKTRQSGSRSVDPSDRPLQPEGTACDAYVGDTPVAANASQPRVTSSRRASKPIDSDVVARLKNDRRHYAVVCNMALRYWQLLCDAGFVHPNLKATPLCTVTVAARIACCFQTVVDPSIRWSFFERHWGMSHLQSNLVRSAYKDEQKYIVVNRIFGRPDDAPFLTKSQI